MNGRWRYVLPNLVTCLSIVAALISIAEAISGHFDSSAWYINLCVLLDKADGTVARALKASSRFGIEMDSLSDLVSFGVAPAILIISFLTGKGAETPLATLPLYRAAVYAGCFLYVIGAALRLAKFNVLTDVYGKEFFFGIPTTTCGALVSCAFLTARKYSAPPLVFELAPALMLVFALLMVSRLPLPKIGKRKTLVMNVFTLASLLFVYVFALLRILPEYLLALGLIYLIPGLIWALAKGIKPPKLSPSAAKAAPPPQRSVDDDSMIDESMISDSPAASAPSLPEGEVERSPVAD